MQLVQDSVFAPLEKRPMAHAVQLPSASRNVPPSHSGAGAGVGEAVGAPVGTAVGVAVGEAVGLAVGASVGGGGAGLGAFVGDGEGLGVGDAVGASVSTHADCPVRGWCCPAGHTSQRSPEVLALYCPVPHCKQNPGSLPAQPWR